MPTINASFPSLLDQIKRMEPNGSIARIVEMLSQRNAFLEDAVFVEGNLPTGHRFTSRTGLPSVAWRRFNEGITPGKSRTDQVDETCGMLSGRSACDPQLAKLNGNEAAFRASEDAAFVQALNNDVEAGIVYHSTLTAPEKFMGLSPRLNATTDPGGSQLILNAPAGDTDGSDQTSMWLISWSPDTVFGIYPKGSRAGIEVDDLGKVLIDDGSGKDMLAWVTEWTWKLGLCVKDWRYLVRICNIDTSALAATGDTLIVSMIKAYSQLQDTKTGRLAFYCNRTVFTYLWLQARNAVKNSTLTVSAPEGKPVLSFMGIPVRVTDAILNNEAELA